MIVITLLNGVGWRQVCCSSFFRNRPQVGISMYQYENWHWTYSRDGIVNVLSLTIYKYICILVVLPLPIVLRRSYCSHCIFLFYLEVWPILPTSLQNPNQAAVSQTNMTWCSDDNIPLCIILHYVVVMWVNGSCNELGNISKK